MADDNQLIDPSGDPGQKAGGGILKNMMLRLEIRSINQLNTEFDKLKGHLKQIRGDLEGIKQLGDVMGGINGRGGGTTAAGQRTYGDVVDRSKSGDNTVSDTSVNTDVAGDNTAGTTRYRLRNANGMYSGNLRSYLPSVGRSVIADSVDDAFEAYANAQSGNSGYGASLSLATQAFKKGLKSAGPLGAAGLAAMGSQVLSSIGGQISAPLDARIDRGYAYSLSADKLSVMYQMTTGMSQRQVMDSYRQPLTAYRLGEGGINTLMGMQAQTGLSALLQAGSAESLRTMNGYGYSTEDATKMITSLADPSVVNRMFMMTGTSLYGIGGKENSAMSVIQNLAGSISVDSEERARQALAPGSITRARLASMGLSSEMQNQVINYAAQNAQFKKQGGVGNLDYTNDAHRQKMGIEENFATQAEETVRQQMGREENFYSRQADNFASLERMTQTLTRAFGELEDQLQGLIGAKISTNPVTKMAGKASSALGMGLLAGGAAATATGPGAVVGVPMMIAGGILSFAGGLFGGGDAEVTPASRTNPGSANRRAGALPIDPNMKIPGQGGTVGGLMKLDTFSKMNPILKERVLNVIMEAGGRVGVNNGWRSSSDQAKLFFGRYNRTNRSSSTPQKNKSDRSYDGVWWEKKPGFFDTAPPGKSFHEIGLAVDFQGDLQLASDIGKKYGLYTFENTSTKELHHAQPVETPSSWQEYVNSGAKFGLGNDFSVTPSGDESPNSSSGGYSEDGGGGMRTLTSLAGMSLSDMIASAGLLASGGGGRSMVSSTGNLDSSSLANELGNATNTAGLSGVLSGNEIVAVMENAGFSGNDLTKAVAISWRESRWNSKAHNPKPPDNSYGLMQINMLDKPGYMLGEERRKRYGIRNEDLFNPNTNARVARDLVGDGGGWTHWRPGDGKGGSLPETYATNMAWAAQVVRAAHKSQPIPSYPGNSGDAPVDSGSQAARPRAAMSSAAYQAAASNSQTSVLMANREYNVNISPTINISGNAGQQDLQRMAKEIGKLIEKEAKHVLLRES